MKFEKTSKELGFPTQDLIEVKQKKEKDEI